MVTLVDLGICNLRSVQKAFGRLEVECRVTSDPGEVRRAERLVLPGVGHFRMAMERMNQLRLCDAIRESVLDRRTPILGICLGMQLLTRGSEEGAVEGVGLIDADTVRFRLNGLKVPHMGWNQAARAKDSELLDGVADEDSFYFVHSYYVHCDHEQDVLCTTLYGGPFHSAFQSGFIAGVQFHPEKSHGAGLRLLSNFARA